MVRFTDSTLLLVIGRSSSVLCSRDFGGHHYADTGLVCVCRVGVRDRLTGETNKGYETSQSGVAEQQQMDKVFM